MEANMAPLRSSVPRLLVSLAMIVSIFSAAPIALARDQTGTRHVSTATLNEAEVRFTVDNNLAISKMSLCCTLGVSSRRRSIAGK
jgi:hypothetical protein